MKGSNRLTLENLSVCKKTVRKLLKVDPIHLLQVAALLYFALKKIYSLLSLIIGNLSNHDDEREDDDRK